MQQYGIQAQADGYSRENRGWAHKHLATDREDRALKRRGRRAHRDEIAGELLELELTAAGVERAADLRVARKNQPPVAAEEWRDDLYWDDDFLDDYYDARQRDAYWDDYLRHADSGRDCCSPSTRDYDAPLEMDAAWVALWVDGSAEAPDDWRDSERDWYDDYERECLEEREGERAFFCGTATVPAVADLPLIARQAERERAGDRHYRQNHRTVNHRHARP